MGHFKMQTQLILLNAYSFSLESPLYTHSNLIQLFSAERNRKNNFISCLKTSNRFNCNSKKFQGIFPSHFHLATSSNLIFLSCLSQCNSMRIILTYFLVLSDQQRISLFSNFTFGIQLHPD